MSALWSVDLSLCCQCPTASLLPMPSILCPRVVLCACYLFSLRNVHICRSGYCESILPCWCGWNQVTHTNGTHCSIILIFALLGRWATCFAYQLLIILCPLLYLLSFLILFCIPKVWFLVCAPWTSCYFSALSDYITFICRRQLLMVCMWLVCVEIATLNVGRSILFLAIYGPMLCLLSYLGWPHVNLVHCPITLEWS
jgi:hypothetical protein